MALGTLTKVDSWREGNKQIRVYDVQLTSGANYTTGGETVNATSIGLRAIVSARANNLALPSGAATSRSVGVVFTSSNRQSVKLTVHTTASAEAAASSDQSTFTARIEFVGY